MTTPDSPTSASSDGTIEFPAAPREVPAAVAKAATFEPRVRAWLVLAVVIVVIAAYLGLSEYRSWAYDRNLIVNGVAVNATVVEAAWTDIKGRRLPWNSMVKLQYPTNAGAEQVIEGFLKEKPTGGEVVVVGQTVPIRYDAQQPARWTDRKEVPSIANALLSVYMLLPAAVVALVIGFWQRSRVLKTYATGNLTAAAVVSRSMTPIAPGYHKVVAAPGGDRSGGTVTVYVPQSRGVAKGDVIHLLLPSRSGVPLAVDAF